MSDNLYELISLGARYVFVLLMLLIVIRAWRITIIDSRRAAKLRRWAPETGVVGEMQVLEGNGKVRRGMLFPVIREGMIGRSRKADIRLRCNAVRRRHAYFEMTENGLLVRAAGTARILGPGGRARAVCLEDGSVISIGGLRLMLILTHATVNGQAAAPVRRQEPSAPDIFEAEPTFATSSGGEVHQEDIFTHLTDDSAADAALYDETLPLFDEEDKPNPKDKEEWWPNG